MKLLFILILFLAFQSSTLAQYMQINWQTCHQVFPGKDYSTDIVPTGDGYMVCGRTVPDGASSPVMLLFKADLSGNVLWNTTYGGSNADAAYGITTTYDGNFIIAGNSGSNDGDVSYNPYFGFGSYWALKIDHDGNILWDRIYGGNGKEGMKRIIHTADGGFALFGSTTSNDGDVSVHYGSNDMWMVKADSLGEIQWDYTIGGIGIDLAHTIIQTADGGYLLGGSAQVAGGGNYECEPYNWYAETVLFKIDSNANVEWQRCYSSSHHDVINALLETGDGYLVVGGTTAGDGDMTGCGYHPGYDHLGYPTTDIWLAKLDFSGDIVWQRCLGGSGRELAKNLFETIDGDYLLFGRTNSHDGDVSGNNSYPDPAYSDIWVVKLSADGELLWQQCIGGLGDLSMPDVTHISYDTYLVATRSTSPMSGDITCFMPSGYIWMFEVTDLTVGISEQPAKQSPVKIFPNPATTELWLQLPENLQFAQVQIELYSPTGRLLYKLQPASQFHKIKTTHLPPGLYLVRVWDGKQWFGEKVVVRK